MTDAARSARHALVIMGTAGAGKTVIGTRLATALSVPFVEGDAFHPPANVTKMAAGVPLTDDDRWGWLDALAAQLRAAREAGSGVVLACSALKRSYRDVLRSGDADVQFVLLQAPADVLRARIAARPGHFMPVSLVDSQLATLEPPGADERALRIETNASADAVVAALMTRLRAQGPR